MSVVAPGAGAGDKTNQCHGALGKHNGRRQKKEEKDQKGKEEETGRVVVYWTQRQTVPGHITLTGRGMKLPPVGDPCPATASHSMSQISWPT